MDVLARITKLRLDRGWTDYELAKRSGLPQSTISSWYTKNMLPSISSHESICKGLAEITVHPGQRVRAGDPIGTAGGNVPFEGGGHVCVQLLENDVPISYEPK